ncbi:UDP-N-acetylmuramoylalanyl-D-glutamate--2,6-diaminopimelate ligase [Clostridium acidisoli DSM 12555]|uniref:UDP-N-acetylmuramoyl-L-alanyl-D-glutamate--2,6-diaminopimelate ligase n=1 Tax=Clostridium acidisoli DSM 12555 TaxID=1121291 RepID=A0A1W1X1E7_9CLOT|nr:UDP-N-acetylmuramoyl-L-alanyl-D-glutamate--2,6-diaminopimelate ligase [Clostridium acidisoli]SMC17727.1 UDP-N-acetylmuramoylalanyl-D-glutamate--2,6-diaminopimelate ligase [Clostridium acidisoli DSM 12555]
MKLSNILRGIQYEVICGDSEVEVNEIQYDSRKLKKNDLFVCIEGYNTDGHKYISNACKSKVSAIICTKVPESLPECTLIKVSESRKVLALISANYYGHPEKKLKLIGITGTNGKTTSTYMMKKILESTGEKVGLIGTIANYIGDEKIEASRTTPESLELFQLFNKMLEKGVNYCVMEVSSHSLYLNRVYGIEFNEGVFTNLTQDHLDFHKTFENYYNAKLILFKNSKNCIINMDDKYGKKVYSDLENNKITYGINENVDLKAENIKLHSRGIEFDMKYLEKSVHINLNIPGRYNIYNALGSAAACMLEGLTMEQIKTGIESLKAVPGRCEAFESDKKLDFDIIIDYAHTPDSLMNILKTTREFTKNKLIVVFGCGGDRDSLKRPIMGDIGTSMSDIAIITSDNPRSEEPMKIIEDIINGVKKDNYIKIEDRKEAIKKAITIAEKGDVIVIAGKGHEDYQVLKEGKIHFDEREVVAEILKELF